VSPRSSCSVQQSQAIHLSPWKTQKQEGKKKNEQSARKKEETKKDTRQKKPTHSKEDLGRV
jgi:hypothetical protein